MLPDVAWWKKWQGKEFPDQPMNPLSFLVCCLEAKIRHLPHHCLSPVERTTLHPSVRKHLLSCGPCGSFEVHDEALNRQVRQKTAYLLEHCYVIPLSASRHQDEEERELLHTVVLLYETMDGEQLFEWSTNDLECPIQVPILR